MLLGSAIALAAAFGAVARYITSLAMQYYLAQSMWGTLLVNVLGSFGAGVIAGASVAHGLPDAWQFVVSTGFLGAYTTFSTWMVEAAALVHDGEIGTMLLYVLGSTLLGTAAAAFGLIAVL